MSLEYRINSGELIEFETEITRFHFKKNQVRGKHGITNIIKLKEDIMKKYSLSEREFAYNYKMHFDKICSQYPGFNKK